MQLSLALARQHAVTALLELYRESPLGATDLSLRIGGPVGSGLTVCRHLAKFGLVEVGEEPGVAGKSAYRLRLTQAGRKVAEALERAARILERQP